MLQHMTITFIFWFTQKPMYLHDYIMSSGSIYFKSEGFTFKAASHCKISKQSDDFQRLREDKKIIDIQVWLYSVWYTPIRKRQHTTHEKMFNS